METANPLEQTPLENKLTQTEARLRDIEERYEHLVAGMHGLICTYDMEGGLLSINPAACELLGYKSSEILGHNLIEFLTPARRPYFQVFLDRMTESSVDKGILLLAARDGRELTFQYHNIKITRNVEKPYILGHAYDITEITELQRKLEELTITDDLTGLNNRRGFLARANDRISLARRDGEGLQLIFADIDGLKKVNDTHGHACGSQLITDTAEILRDSFRQTDVICRWGGDEFIMLLSEPDETSADVVTERIRQKIDAFNELSSRPYKLAISLGIVPIDTQSDQSLDDIIAEADESMYEHKRNKPR